MDYKINKKDSEWLDAVRGFSAIAVLIAHINQVYNLPVFGLNGFFHLFFGIIARYAVISFFVLSGFLITTSILKNINSNKGFDSLDFFKKRLIRIYPPYLFSILICIIIYYVVNYFQMHGYLTFRTPDDLYLARENFSLTFKNYFQAAFMLNNIVEGYPNSINMNGPLWSISYEWWLYILAMLFSVWAVNKNYVIGGIPFVCCTIYFFYTLNYTFIWFSIFWLLGTLLSFMYFKELRIKKRIKVLFIILLVNIAIVYLLKDWKIIIPFDENAELAFQLLISIILVLIFSFPEHRVQAFTKIFKKSAKFSYTLYVIHFPLILFSYSYLHIPYKNGDNTFRLFILLALMLSIILISSFLSKYLENKSFYHKLIFRIGEKK